MSGFSQTIIHGRLGKDPEIKYTANGQAIANLSVATSETWKDKQTQEKVEKTEWHRVVVFGPSAEWVGERFKKGDLILINGKNQTRKWQDNATGQDKYTTEVVADRFNGVHGAGSGAGGQQQQQSGAGGFRKQPDAAAPAQGKLTGTDFADDDIPF
jgi:single-strand DNA-binding protein